MIRAENVYKSFEDKLVLEDISVEFQQGITNLIIGQSGSGKTVLIKCLVGLHEVDSGSIYYGDRDFTKLDFDERKAIRQEVGMIFQGGALLDSSTVEANVKLPLDLFTRQSEKEKLERVNFCLERVNLPNVNHLYPAELSGGMMKRVAIARAIVLNPRFLFCDEPNSGLDPMTAIVIDNLIQEITKEYNITTIINTHDMNSVMEIGEHIMFIHKGKKWWEGTKDQITNVDNRELNDFVFASKMAQSARKYEAGQLISNEGRSTLVMPKGAKSAESAKSAKSTERTKSAKSTEGAEDEGSEGSAVQGKAESGAKE